MKIIPRLCLSAALSLLLLPPAFSSSLSSPISSSLVPVRASTLAVSISAAADDRSSPVRPSATTGVAQSRLVESDRLRLRMQRQRLVEENLSLNEPQRQAFWLVYGDYRMAVERLNDRSWALLLRWSRAWNADRVDDALARELLQRQADIRRERAELRQHFLNHFLDVLPARKVARFYQLENRMDARLSIDIARQVAMFDS